MADQSMSKSTLEELERLVQDEEFWQLYPARNQAAAGKERTHQNLISYSIPIFSFFVRSDCQ
jgi:hypothetical protein